MAQMSIPAKKKTDKGKKVSASEQNNLAYLYLIPAFLVLTIIVFYPLVYQVIISFTDFTTKDLRLGLASPALNFVGLQNYIRIFTGTLPVQDFKFSRVLVFNLWWAFSNVLVHVPAGVLIAVLLNTPGLWFKRLYRAIYILPVVVPALAVATVWRNIFDDNYGAINQVLSGILGIFGHTDPVRIRWLNEVVPPIPWFLPTVPLPLAYYAMMIANFWLGWPFMCVVATGALQSIPTDLYEAASIDGATGPQKFFNITVPLLKPAIIPAAILGFTTTFNLFSFVYFMTGGGPARETEILVTFAYDLVRNLRLYGAAAAFSVIVFFVSITVFLITNRITRATEATDV